MRWSICILAVGLLGSNNVLAHVNYINPVQYCAQGCSLALQQVNFTTQAPSAGNGFNCSSQLLVESLMLCVGKYCSTRQASVGLATLNETCMSSSLPNYDTSKPYAGLDNAPVVSEDDVASTQYSVAVLPDSTFYAIAHDSIV